MIVLGVDPGTTRPGFGIIEIKGSLIKSLKHGLIEEENVLKPLSLKEQLLCIYNNTSKLIAEYKPQLIGLEDLFFNKNTKTAFSICSVRAVIMLCSAQHNIELLEPTPLQVKKGVTGYANSDKNQVGFMVTKLLGLKTTPKPDDITDALAVAIASAYRFQIESRLSKADTLVIKNI